MRILIVDDEALVRVGMRFIIPWEQHGYQVIGEATNGIEALKLAREHRPDIILVDIVMPQMNGLDFIEEIRNDLPSCKFIILSCKDDVEYYRKAIKLGVSEYIQKSSVSPGEILSAIDRISAEIRKERVFDNNDSAEKAYINQYVVLTEFFNLVLKGQIKEARLIEEKLKSFKLDVSGKYISVIVFSIDLPEGYNGNYDKSHDYSIINISQQIITDMAEGYIFKDYNGMVTAIIITQDAAGTENQARNIGYRVQETASQFFYVDVTCGVSNPASDPAGIQVCYQQAMEALDERFFKGTGGIHFYRQCREDSSVLQHVLDKKEEILKIKSLFDLGEFYTGLREITGIIAESEGITPQKSRSIYMDIMYHLIALLRKDGIDINEILCPGFNAPEYVEKPSMLCELNRRMEYLLDKIKAFYLSKHPGREQSVISLINQYIEQHINERISLDDISRVVHLSSSYISRFYKKETGENLQDYIVRTKVEKSKELLYKCKNLYEVAEGVGFSSQSHFFKVFKFYTGLTPGEFLKRMEE